MERFKRSLAGLKQMVITAIAQLMMRLGVIDSLNAALSRSSESMQINEKGIELIKRFEGLRLEAYPDQRGIWTIGYGSTENVRPGSQISEEEANSLLLRKLGFLEAGISQCVKVPLNENEFSALGCLAYNIGLNAFQRSTLLKLLNQNQRKAASDEFLEWSKVKGEEVPGLLKRRIAERDLFLESIRSQSS